MAPTAGTLEGAVQNGEIAVTVLPTLASPTVFNFGNSSDMQSLVLRGANQCIEIASTSGASNIGYIVNIGTTVE